MLAPTEFPADEKTLAYLRAVLPAVSQPPTSFRMGSPDYVPPQLNDAPANQGDESEEIVPKSKRARKLTSPPSDQAMIQEEDIANALDSPP